MKNLVRSVFCVVLLLFLACKKDFQGDGTKLKMIVSHAPGGDDLAMYTIFNYNLTERLTIINRRSKYQTASTIQLFYDNAGKSARSVTRFTSSSGGLIDSFYYDNNDRIIKMRSVSDDPAHPLYQEIILTYDAAGRLIADTTHDPGYNIHEFNDFNSYQYDANDDLVRWQHSKTFGGSVSSGPPVQASYGNNPNPYKKLGVMYYLLIKDIVVLSAHERASVSYAAGNQETYHYDYFPNGLVKRITTNNSRTIWLDDFLYE